MEYIIGHIIDYNGVGALRGQLHTPSKKSTQVPRAGDFPTLSETLTNEIPTLTYY